MTRIVAHKGMVTIDNTGSAPGRGGYLHPEPRCLEKFAASKVNFDYERLFGRTTKLIPHKPGKRTPDANHIVLHSITVVTVILVYLDRFNL